jgi:hypothetical protein
MTEKRFLKMMALIVILGLSMILMINVPVFAQGYNQDPNIIRTSSLFYSYPAFGYLPAFVSPLYSTGYFGFPQFSGFSLDYATPIGGFSAGQAFTLSPAGGSYHVGGELLLPWTYYGTSIDTSFGRGVVPGPFGFIPTARYGISTQHEAFGIPTPLHATGLHPDVAGQLTLAASAPYTAALDRALSNVYMFTEQGMPFIAVASYFNPDSYGGSNYFFPAGASSYQAEMETVGGIPVSGYEQLTEIPGTAVFGGQATLFSGFRAGFGETVSGNGVSVSPYGGWSGTAGVFGTTSAGSMGLTGGTASWGGSSTGPSGSGFVSGTGTSYGGTNVGWGGGSSSGGTGGSSGFGGGGSMGGGSYGGAPGAGFGGAPAG